jgi:hypothetical protein
VTVQCQNVIQNIHTELLMGVVTTSTSQLGDRQCVPNKDGFQQGTPMVRKEYSTNCVIKQHISRIVHLFINRFSAKATFLSFTVRTPSDIFVQIISDPNNFEIFESKKTTAKGHKLIRQKSTM